MADSATPTPSGAQRFMPVVGSIRGYKRAWGSGDLGAALVVWAILVPESMAYASIAGMPPQTGLYVATVPLLAYALFGTARRLTVGPSATVAALSAATVVPLAAAGSEMFVAYTVLLAMVVGVILIIAGIAKLGIIAEFLSQPVLKGFLLGTAMVIAVGQLDKVLGVHAQGEGFFGQVVSLITQFPEWQVPSLTLGTIAFLLLVALHRFAPKVPAALVVVVLSIIAVPLFDLEAKGIEVVGDIPAGLPSLGLPGLGWDAVVFLVPGALGIAVVVYGESMALAKAFGGRGERLDADRELSALGVANVAGGLFGGFVAEGSSSRTAAASGAGQRTQVSSLIVVGLLVVTMLFLTPLFTNLPEPVLGAIVIHAVLRLLSIKPLQELRARDTDAFVIALATLFGVLVLDILAGLMVGIFISIVLLMKRAVRPNTAILGRDDTTGSYRAVANDNVHAVPGVLVLRFDAELFFANISVLQDIVMSEVEAGGIHAVVLDAEAITHIDTTAAEGVARLLEDLDGAGVTFAVARLRSEPRAMLASCGVNLAHDRTHPRVADAVQAVLTDPTEGGGGSHARP